MLEVVGTVALDTLARVPSLAQAETTGAVLELRPDEPGGTAGNLAAALGRLGWGPRLHGAVGEDLRGGAYEARLRKLGVVLEGLTYVDEPTARAYVFHDGEGAQVTYFYPGASKRYVGDPAAFAGKRAHFCAGEIAAYPRLMEAAAWVSFDPGQEVFHRDLREIEACLPHVDLLFVNRSEMSILESKLGWSLRRLFDAGVETVVETRGGEGTLVHSPSGRFAAPAVETTVADPTGAGDAHRAGFLFARHKGADLGRAARFANVLGAAAVERVGAQVGQLDLAEALARHEKVYHERPF